MIFSDSDSEDERTGGVLEIMTVQSGLIEPSQAQVVAQTRVTQTPVKSRTSIGSAQSTPGKTPGKTPRRDRILWSYEEDNLLREGVRKYPNLDWLLISIDIPAKSVLNCRHRWTRVIDPSLKKGHWTEEEDQLLAHLISEMGTKYTEIALSLPGRTGKQCRNRWLMTLDPALSKRPFSEEEYKVILKENQRLGNNWKAISDNLPGRTGALIGTHFHHVVMPKIMRYMDNVDSGGSGAINDHEEAADEEVNEIKFMQFRE
jgi:myb proto-oncogene protein